MKCLERLLFRYIVRAFSGALICSNALGAAGDSPEQLRLDDYVQHVLNHNDQVQIAVLQTAINRQLHQAQKGIFEPEFVLNYDFQDSARPNTTEQARNQQGVSEFDQENSIYGGGLESLIPTGARLRLGYTLSDLSNNLQGASSIFGGSTSPGDEYVTFVGLSMIQPLLKNGWSDATMAQIRLAARESDQAFQNYRRELMRIVTTAESLYWDLYYAQEQVGFLEESARIAENLFNDTKVKQSVGSSSELEVMEVESALALRRTQLEDARQGVIDNVNRVLSLYSRDIDTFDKRVVAVDSPNLSNIERLSYFQAMSDSYDYNPDLLAQKIELEKQGIRVDYAKNQRLPQLDLKASYGANGLGDSPETSYADAESGDFIAWSVGIEFRVPLSGGKKVKRELEAAKLQSQQAYLTLKNMETQVSNALKTALHNVQSTYASVNNHSKVVGFYENLLNTQIERFDVGTIENQRVLETEEDLLEARTNELQSRVRFQRALMQVQLLSGNALRNRNLELSQELLAERTSSLLAQKGVDGKDYQWFQEQMRSNYRYQDANTSSGTLK